MKKYFDINNAQILPILIIYILGIILYPYLHIGNMIYILLLTGIILSISYFIPTSPIVKYLLRISYSIGIILIFYSSAQINIELQNKNNVKNNHIEEGKNVIIFKINSPYIISEDKSDLYTYLTPLRSPECLIDNNINTIHRLNYKDISKCIYNYRCLNSEAYNKNKINDFRNNSLINKIEEFKNIDIKLITYFNYEYSLIDSKPNTEYYTDKNLFFNLINKSHRRIEHIKEGDILISIGELRKLKNKGNPEEFDYAGFMKRKKVEYIFYADTTYISNINHLSFRENFIYSIRNYINQSIEAISEKENNKAFLRAITLGDKTNIDLESKNNFSKAGLSHILALSGLHTGIIYMIILWFLFPLAYFNGRIQEI